MAEEPKVNLEYMDGCGDCGKRKVELPAALPNVGDDFDWDVRDYDGFRLFMLEELAARFPERRNWTPADMEVVLVETLSVVLDQLADMHDRIQAESYLETARRPDTVRRMLEMIGYKPTRHINHSMRQKFAELEIAADKNITDEELEKLWSYYPYLMEEAKQAGPRSIHQQRRMVTLEDYRNQLIGHPLVLDVDACSDWSGSWNSHFVVVRLVSNLLLDDVLSVENIVDPAPDATADDIATAFDHFRLSLEHWYQQREIAEVPDVLSKTPRFILQLIIEQQRMIGQEVLLQDATLVGIVLSVSVRIAGDYYRSEINDAVHEALLESPDGFFSPGGLQFGEDVVASDIIEILMTLDGVESVCINRMKRTGSIYADQSGSGRIVLQGHEVAVLENDATVPERGSLRVVLHGGKPG